MRNFKIQNFSLKNNRPFIVAEISSNHQNKLKNILKLISELKKNGADAVKIQTYDENVMTIDSNKREFKIQGGIWNKYKLYDLYAKAKTPYSWHSDIFKYSKKIGITCFSSPFNESCVDFLEKFNVPAYKVASFEIVDLPLIKYIAKKQKPVILYGYGKL